MQRSIGLLSWGVDYGVRGVEEDRYFAGCFSMHSRGPVCGFVFESSRKFRNVATFVYPQL